MNIIASIYREMTDNMRISFIPANSFQGMTEEYVDMWVLETHSLCYHIIRARSNNLSLFVKNIFYVS